jgi:serine/threonine-protein kinase RsbW
MELTLPARPETVTLARQALIRLAGAEGWEPGLTGGKMIAAGERLANAVTHAYPACRPDPVAVHVERSDRDVAVIVCDRGTGIAPSVRRDRAGPGLGLPLMSALADELSLRTRAGASTEIRRTVTLAGREDA